MGLVGFLLTGYIATTDSLLGLAEGLRVGCRRLPTTGAATAVATTATTITTTTRITNATATTTATINTTSTRTAVVSCASTSPSAAQKKPGRVFFWMPRGPPSPYQMRTWISRMRKVRFEDMALGFRV